MVCKLEVNTEWWEAELVEAVSLELGLGSWSLGEESCGEEDEMTEVLFRMFCWELRSHL